MPTSGANNRIALFQAEWPVQTQTFNCAQQLSQNGYIVDVFFSETRAYVDLDQLQNMEGIHVHFINANNQQSASTDFKMSMRQSTKVVDRLRLFLTSQLRARIYPFLRNVRQWYRLITKSQSTFGMLSNDLVSQAVKLMDGKHYHCLIGIEKKGLIWAGQIAREQRIPLVYYSLELYTDDFWRKVMKRSISFKRLKQVEAAFHRAASATIIQDSHRAEVLLQDNHVSCGKVFYLPVSVMGVTHTQKSHFLHHHLDIPLDQKIILYFGLISENRYVLDLVKAAQKFPPNCILVLHGEVASAQLKEKIEALDIHNKVKLSTQLVSAEKIPEVIASADIGTAFYTSDIQNNLLTAFSSEKMALYMQCGVPFVAFDYPGYRKLADEFGCGMTIKGMDELPAVVEIILDSHDKFRRRTFEAYLQYYDYQNNFQKVLVGLADL